jgi:hypothetical protein
MAVDLTVGIDGYFGCDTVFSVPSHLPSREGQGRGLNVLFLTSLAVQIDSSFQSVIFGERKIPEQPINETPGILQYNEERARLVNIRFVFIT